MPRTPLDDVLRYLRRSFAAHAARDLTDGELLERFVNQREEAAVTILVQRHGPMVLSVCRRLLGSSDGAEDAFQATFLVLVRRARAIGRREPLGAWLYAVAQRIAMKARAQAGARRHRERRFAPMPCADALDDLTWRELRSVLDEEIGRLPEKYKTPIVLCYFEGKSYDQAAKELGLAKSSLGNRVVRGRKLLRKQLVRREIMLSAGAVATALCEKVAGASLPALLTIKTVKAAALVAAGKPVAGGCLSATALALAEEAMTGMFWLKSKMVLLVLALGLAIGGAGVANYGGREETAQPTPVAQSPLPNKQLPIPAKEVRPVLTDQYGDPLPEGAVARLGTVRFRHEGEASRLGFTGDGKILVGSTRTGIIFWDATTGKELRRLKDEEGARVGAQLVAVTPDGNNLAVVGPSNSESSFSISWWEIQTGKKIKLVSFQATKGEPRVLDFDSRMKISPDGKMLALSWGRMVSIFDTTTGERKASFGQGKGFIYDLAFSPDNKTLAVGTLDPPLQLWEIATGKLLHGIIGPKREFVHAVAFSPNGKIVVAGLWDRITLSDPATGKQLGLLESKMESIKGLAFTPDGKTLVSGSQDGRIRVWNVATGDIRFTLKSGMNAGRTIALSSDGTTVAMGTAGNAVQLWNVVTGKELTQFQGHHSSVECLAFSPDGKTVASVDYQTRLWDVATWKPARVLPGDTYSLSFSPDSQKLASIVLDKTVHVRNMDSSNESLVIKAPNAEITSAEFSTDGNKLFTLDTDPRKSGSRSVPTYRLRHWNAATGQQENMWTIPGEVRELTVTPDGMGTLATHAKTIRYFNVKSGQTRILHDSGKVESTTIVVSPDARTLLSGNWSESFTANLWEIATGKIVHVLQGHDGLVTAAAWSSDSRFVATCGDYLTYGYSNKCSVQLWDAATGQELARFGGLGTAVANLTFSPDGSYLVGGLRDSTILVWDVREATRAAKQFSRKMESGELEDCWADLILDDAPQAHRAIWRLIFARAQAAPFLRERVQLAPVMHAAKIQKWIADLDSQQFAVRQTAAKELEKVGAQVMAPIQKAIKDNASLEARLRMEQILKNLDVPGPATLRSIRAIMALERIGSPEAQSVLEALARGAPGARQTEESRASLERLGRRASKMP